ncbi:hypothetical protein J6590_065937 [Homalodisca vitripennis]|nr:hypothetical protein J6590_065937 [Homalodisca vitripennis]
MSMIGLNARELITGLVINQRAMKVELDGTVRPHLSSKLAPWGLGVTLRAGGGGEGPQQLVPVTIPAHNIVMYGLAAPSSEPFRQNEKSRSRK